VSSISRQNPVTQTVPYIHHPISTRKQESRALTGKHRAMRGTCTESLHLIIGKCSEKKQHKLSANMGSCRKTTLKLIHLCTVKPRNTTETTESTIYITYNRLAVDRNRKPNPHPNANTNLSAWRYATIWPTGTFFIPKANFIKSTWPQC